MKKQQYTKLDIACGKNKKPGFTGVDIWDGADIVADLEQFPWPFADNSVDEVFCSHYIEHTPDLISFANELYRIMKVGAKAEIIAPYYSSIRAWQDPTHLRAISENTYLYFSKEWRTINKLDHYPITGDFDFECSYIIDPEWQEKNDEELRFAIKHYINVVSDIRAVLTKRKPLNDELELLLQRASKSWDKGNLEEAIAICNQLVECGEAGLDEYLMIADYSARNAEFTKAIEMYKKALKIDEESFQAHVGLIRSLNSAGLMTKAQSYIKKIKKKDEELAELIVAMISEEK